ncbi:hypothetical protein FVE85_6455 [Porphyridium purpureum]|uniref:Transmembrane protein n=1 Tax=Porphyridium purpureum TaxID=35688 RepID=A0A5J4Z6Q4_PORPP|nr:hypothetical protein FVE85_6455 [Porphyridium purpureum]|eukprot:POR4708..scf295_1
MQRDRVDKEQHSTSPFFARNPGTMLYPSRVFLVVSMVAVCMVLARGSEAFDTPYLAPQPYVSQPPAHTYDQHPDIPYVIGKEYPDFKAMTYTRTRLCCTTGCDFKGAYDDPTIEAKCSEWKKDDGEYDSDNDAFM